MTFDLPDVKPAECIFCSIVSGSADARWVRAPHGDSAVACFHNRLNWVRVMLLVVPVRHTTQVDFWLSEEFAEAARMAVELGDEHCGSEGYRLISNFGLQAHQSVAHAHIHVISGASRILESATQTESISSDSNFAIDEYQVDETPYAAQLAPNSQLSQREFWTSDEITQGANEIVGLARSHSPNGFRFMSSFSPATESHKAGSNPASIFLLGGGQLGLYGSSY